jgi:PAS domain S-box-containing protein
VLGIRGPAAAHRPHQNREPARLIACPGTGSLGPVSLCLSKSPARYAITVLLVAIALLVTRWLGPPMQTTPTPLFFLAIMLSARFGLRSGLLATALSVLAIDYSFIPPLFSFAIDTEYIPSFAIFALSALSVAWLSAAQRSAAQSLRDARDELAAKVQELKRGNEALQESEQRFRDYAETASDSSWETGPDHRFTRVSKALIEVGTDTDSLIGARRWEFATDVEEEPEKWRLHIAALEARRPFRGFIYRTLMPVDNSVVYVSTSGKPIFDGEGRFLGYRGVSSDVTAAVRAEQAEEALAQARSELAHVARVTTLGELTASIAHEINQPIGAVVTNADAGLHWLGAEPPDLEEARQTLGRILNEGHRASEVIGRIRALVKKSPTLKDRLDINDTIREVIALTHCEIQNHRISLQTQLASELPPILGDRIQLHQVILNLIINAIEAMTADSEEPRELKVVSENNGTAGVLVAVRDRGAGLVTGHLDRVFDPFYSTKPDGMGMGLAISRSIVEAHGGRLWAAHNAPKGAIFQFTLPPAAEEGLSSKQPSSPSYPGASLRSRDNRREQAPTSCRAVPCLEVELKLGCYAQQWRRRASPEVAPANDRARSVA